MTVMKQIWKCDVCGNVVEVLHKGADSLVCCGVPMGLVGENVVDVADRASQVPPLGVKHVPVISGKKVKVGSVAHPMTEEHYIEWVEASSESGLAPCKKFLKSGDSPEVEFPFSVVSARAYCNVHGLWALREKIENR